MTTRFSLTRPLLPLLVAAGLALLTLPARAQTIVRPAMLITFNSSYQVLNYTDDSINPAVDPALNFETAPTARRHEAP
ncbi:MAG: hypothetical protein H7343_18405 [Undibacterium sp.]|nr:hypothetical protein [Opitutaceae bacterium]